jgi:diguanylate cyclase (GGDEF)-like protein
MDCVARWGGEEFLILLKETDKELAQRVAERLRKIIASMPLIYQNKKVSLTVTIGVSEYNDEKSDLDDIIREADIAMYKGKSHGKNCVISA